MNTKIYFCSFVMMVMVWIAPLSTQAQNDAWETKAEFPAQGRDHPVGFGINNTGYAMVGMVETVNGIRFLDDFYKYAPSEDKWESKGSFPGAARGFSIGIAHQGKGYIGFGAKINRAANQIEPLKDLWEYNPETDSWNELPPCPCDARRHPAMEAVNGKIYVGLGDGGDGNLKDWWVFDLETEEWSQIPDMPGPPRHHPYHFTVDGNIYAGMGHGSKLAVEANPNGILDDWYEYDPKDSSWTEMDKFPGQPRVAGTQFANGDYGYILSGDGGNHSYMDSGQFWRYNPANDEWKELPAHPGISLWAPTNFVLNDEVMMIGGLNRRDGTRDARIYSYQLASTTGVASQTREEEALSLYPNPVSNNLQVDLKGKAIRNLSILDMNGKVVKRTGSRTGQLNVSLLDNGTYLLRIQDEAGEWHQHKFIKQ